MTEFGKSVRETTEFEKRMRMMHRLGIRYHREVVWRGEAGRDRHPVELDRFESVELPLTDEDWCRMCMNEREEYAGGCCGTMSYIQDTVNHWFRFEGGWVKCAELSDVAELFVGHGDVMWESFDKAQEAALTDFDGLEAYVENALERWSEFGSWDKVHITWLIVKDHFAPAKPKPLPDHLSEWDKATNVIVKGCRAISWDRVFDRDGPSKKSGQADAQVALTLARMYPAMKTLWEGLQERVRGTLFEGYGIFRRADDGSIGAGSITYNGLGMCVYSTREKAEEIFRLWREQDEDRGRGSVEGLEIWPVKVTAEDGLLVVVNKE